MISYADQDQDPDQQSHDTNDTSLVPFVREDRPDLMDERYLCESNYRQFHPLKDNYR